MTTAASISLHTNSTTSAGDQAIINIATASEEREIRNAMDFEIMEGEEDYESPVEISNEALKRIERMKKRGSAVARIANLLN